MITAITDKIKKQRSCAYPLYSLPETVQFAKKIYDGLGQGPFSRLSLSKGLGYSSFSGAASGKIGALVHFGLLDRARASYALTAMAKEILAYPAELSLPAIVDAALHPVLFEKLFRRFENASLPLDLPALLETEFGITAKAAPQAVLNFVSTLEFAGLLKENIIQLPVRRGSVPEILFPNIEGAGPRSRPEEEGNGEIRIKLPSGIVIIFPPEMSYRVSLGEFAPEIKSIDRKTGGTYLQNAGDFHLPPEGSAIK